MIQNLSYEIKPSILNLLNSDFSTKEISDACNISQTTINELRNEKRELENTSLQNALSLYRFSIRHNLDTVYLEKEEQKGHFSNIPLNLSISKVMVSFEDYDLFAYGILKNYYEKTKFPNNLDELKELHLSSASFITKDGKIYHCDEFGYQFKCRYRGNGPGNFVRFLQEYSKIDEEELEKVIFSNSVVEYDFQTDTITGHPSIIEGSPFTLYSLNEKLIVLLNKYDSTTLMSDRTDISLESASSDISFLVNMLAENYNLSPKIKDIFHIPSNAQESVHSLRQIPRYERPTNGISIILDYGDFEIWLPYKIYQKKGDIFKNKEMLLLLDGLGVTYNPEKKNFIQTIFDSHEPIADISRISVQYEEESE